MVLGVPAHAEIVPIIRKNNGSQGENIMIERRKLLKIGASGIAASVAMPFVGRTGWAATPTHTLKLTFADTQAHPLYDVLKRFSEDVSKRTSGAIEIQVFSIGQLGSGTNILTGLQTGIIDFCAHTSGFIDTIFPKFQVVDLPFLFSDLGVRRARAGRTDRRASCSTCCRPRASMASATATGAGAWCRPSTARCPSPRT